MPAGPLRIVVTAPGFFPHSFGGGETFVLRLAHGLKRRGHRVLVVTAKAGGDVRLSLLTERYEHEGIPVIGIPSGPDPTAFPYDARGYETWLRQTIMRIIDEFRTDLVHVNGLKPPFVRACSEMDIPHVVHVHHAGVICPSGSLLKPDHSVCNDPADPSFCVPCCSSWRRPSWYTGGLIGRIPRYVYRPLGRALSVRNRLTYIERGLVYPWVVEETILTRRKMLGQAQVVVAPSLFVRDLLMRNGVGAAKVAVIPHGVETVSATPMGPIIGRPIRFGYVGRIEPLKGLHLLLGAAELLGDRAAIEIHVFGAPRNELDAAYYRRILGSYHGKARLIDHGLIAHERLGEAFSSIDIVVVPSLLPEVFGLVVAEAFSAGRPAIVSQAGGLSEQVTDGLNGIVIPSASTEKLAEVMGDLATNPAMIGKLASGVRPPRSQNEFLDDIEALYSRLTAPTLSVVLSSATP